MRAEAQPPRGSLTDEERLQRGNDPADHPLCRYSQTPNSPWRMIRIRMTLDCIGMGYPLATAHASVTPTPVKDTNKPRSGMRSEARDKGSAQQ